MSRRNSGGGREAKLDLELHLSPPRAQRPMVESPNQSPTSSCLSSEHSFDETSIRFSSSPDAISMMLAGCPRCLMYVMFDEKYQPKCPKCKSTVLLDVLNGGNIKTTKKELE
ncbi:hypothetical protein HanPSC8_Chr11g0492571 [Helianthus annuus]|nr:hypothetical protein HanPSC8_Chr11g0492571 [Helianthus annuus]